MWVNVFVGKSTMWVFGGIEKEFEVLVVR